MAYYDKISINTDTYKSIVLRTRIARGPAQRFSPSKPALAVATALAFASPSWANPTGGQVVSGQAAINTPTPTSMVIDQASNKAIINWNSFSIGANESVRFNQPSASSLALNRVLGNTGSEIFGSLSANGQLFLINPNGVLMGRGAQISAAGFLASTLGISDSDFLGGRYSFTRGSIAGSVINEGTINTSGGYTALIAPNVENHGLISARLGSVGLAAGDRVTLDFADDGMMRLGVDQAALNAAIRNSGTITADGGRVVLSAKSANALLDTVLNNDGVIRANTLVERNGRILLESGPSGVVSVSGTLDASGAAAGQSGGAVSVLGQNVGLFGNANVNVSGDAGGGTALIGGNFQGKGPEANAARTIVASGASINADAITNGNGGKVIVWANDSTRFYGAISARGGAQGGDGGFAEISGKKNLGFDGLVSLSAPKGRSGTVLLDPNDLYLGANPGTAIVGSTNPFNATGGADFFITAAAISGLGDVNITFSADHDVIFNTPIAAVNTGANIFSVTAVNTITMGANTLTTAGGGIAFTAGAGGIALGALNVGAGTVSLTTTDGGSITQDAAGKITADALTLATAGANATLNTATNAIAKLGTTTLGTGALNLKTGGSLTVTGAVNATGGITLESVGQLDLQQSLNAGPGTVSLITTGSGIGLEPITQSGAGALKANALLINTSNSNATLESSTNAIAELGSNASPVSLGTGKLSLTNNNSAGLGGLRSIFSVTATGGITIQNNTGTLDLFGVLDASNGAINVTSKGSITIGDMNAKNNIELRSTNDAIISSEGGDITSTSGNITLRAKTDIDLPFNFLQLMGPSFLAAGNLTLISETGTVTATKYSVGDTLTVQTGVGATLDTSKIADNLGNVQAPNVSLIAESITFGNTIDVSYGETPGKISIAPVEIGKPVVIGASAATADLTINQAALDKLTSAAELTIGRTGDNAIIPPSTLNKATTTGGLITVGTATVGNAKLNLYSSGADNSQNTITQDGALTINAGTGTLSVTTAGGNAKLDNAGNTLGTLGNVCTLVNGCKIPLDFSGGAGSFTLVDAAGGLTVTGPVGASAIDIKAQGGSLAIGGSMTANGSGITLTNPTGSVTQNVAIATTDLTVNTKAGAGDITLDNSGNSISGTATLTSNGAAELKVSGGLAAILAVTGNTTLAAGGNLAVSGATNNLITTTGSGTTIFGTTAVAGTLGVTSTGEVSQTGPLTVTGTATVNAAGQNITLNNANNDFTGLVTLTGKNIDLMANASHTLNVAGTATENAILTGDPIIGLNAGGDLTINASGGPTTIGVAQNITVGGNLSLTNTDTVTQTAGKSLQVSGTTLIDGTVKNAAITLNEPANHFGGTATFKGSTIDIVDSGALTTAVTATNTAKIKSALDQKLSGSGANGVNSLSTDGALTVDTAGIASATGDVILLAKNDLTLTGSVTANGATGTVDLQSTAGSVVSTIDTGAISGNKALLRAMTNVNIDCANLTCTGNSIGAGGVAGFASDGFFLFQNNPALDIATAGGVAGITSTKATLLRVKAGNLTQQATSPITAAGGLDFEVQNGSAILTSANNVTGNVGGFAFGANNTINFRNAGSFNIGLVTIGAISDGGFGTDPTAGSSITLTSDAGAITQDAGTLPVIRTNTLRITTSGKNATLGNSLNNITNLDTVTLGAGVFTLSNTGDLTVVAPAGASGGISLNTIGTLTSNSTLTAGGTNNVDLAATGANSDIVLNGATSSGSGSISANAGKDITINTGGDITTTGNVTLNAAKAATTGTVTEAGGKILTAALLTTSSMGGTKLNNANTVNSFNAANTGGGNVELINAAAPLTITGISNTGGGNNAVVNAGAITTTGKITTSGSDIALTATGATLTIGSDVTAGGSGKVDLVATGAASDVLINAAVSSASGPINLKAGAAITEAGAGAGTLSTTGLLTTLSGKGQELNNANKVNGFKAANTGSGDIALSNTAALLTITGITNFAANGRAAVANTGALNTTGVISTANGAISLTATGGALAVNSIISASAGDVALTTTGANNPITQTSAIVSANNLTATTEDSLITLTNVNNDFAGTVTVTGGATQITDKNALTLGALATGDLTVISTGALNLGQGTVTGNFVANSNGGAVSQNAAPSALAVTGTSKIDSGAGAITLTNGANDFTGAVSLNNSGANDVAIVDKIGLILTTTIVGQKLDVTAGAPGITLVGNVTSSGAQTYNSAVSLGADVIVTGFGNTFAGTINGAKSLTVNDSGATTFGGSIGGTAALSSLTTDAPGTSSSVGVITSGATSFNDNTTLSGTYTSTGFTAGGTSTLAGTTTINAGAGPISFTGTLNGANAFTANSSGATTFGAAVGTTTKLASVTTDAGGSTAINGEAIIASGGITLNDAVTGNNVSLNAGAGTIIATNASNDFTGTLSLNNSGVNNVSITDANSLILGASNVGNGTFTVIAKSTSVEGAVRHCK